MVPDLTKKSHAQKLEQWNGEYKFLAQVPTKRFKPIVGMSLPSFLQLTTAPIVENENNNNGGEQRLLEILVQK